MRGDGAPSSRLVAEAGGAQQLWQALNGAHAELAAALERAARVAGLAARVDAALLARFGLGSLDAQRAALCEGNWAGYSRELNDLGTACATSDVDLHTWFDVLDAGHAVLLEQPLARSTAARRAAAHLREVAMTNIGQGYVAARAEHGQIPALPEDLYHQMFLNSSSGMLIYRFEDHADLGSFRLMSANAAAARAAHPRIFEQVGKRLSETSPYLLQTDVPRHYADAVQKGKSRRWTITTDSSALAQKTYEAHSFSLRGDYVGVTFDDVSERRRLEGEIQGHVVELERSNRELDDFAYAASHDLKGPLLDVKTLAGWIHEDLGADLPADTARHVKVMMDRVSRMERLLEDLLAYSRAGRVSAPPEQFAIRDVIDDVLALMTLPSGFVVKVAADVPKIRTPRPPLAQVIRNLVGNALKHHDRPSGAIEITVSEEKDRLRVEVTDDGPGIPPEFHDRVFRVFQTLRPRDDVEGSGIGLAIVKKVVESHGGLVGILSSGRGTTIHFSWPRESEK